MPRNKSEKLPQCPEAIAYLKACESWLAGEFDGSFNSLWQRLPRPVSRIILDCCGTRPGGGADREWRRSVVSCIRERYAA